MQKKIDRIKHNMAWIVKKATNEPVDMEQYDNEEEDKKLDIGIRQRMINLKAK